MKIKHTKQAKISKSDFFSKKKKMSYQSDAISWLTVVRNRQHIGDDDIGSSNNAACLIKPTPNRWLMNNNEILENADGNNNIENANHRMTNTSFRAGNSAMMLSTSFVRDDERDKETAELMSERERRRSYKWKTLLLQRAPPQNPCETVSSMAFGFDGIDTKSFQSNITQMFRVKRNNNNNNSKTQIQQNNSAAAKQAFSNVEQRQQNILSNNVNNTNSTNSNNNNSASGLFRLSDDGTCIAHGLKTAAEIDYVVHQLQNNNAQRSHVTLLDVSNGKAVQQFQVAAAGPLMKKFLPLCFTRDDCAWLNITVLIADNCDLHDFDADLIGDAIREPSCALERISLRNNVITEKGADRLKKAVKYNSRILHVELGGNAALQKPASEKTRQILAQLEERLELNRRKKQR